MDTHKENFLKIILGLFSMVLLIYIGSTLFKKARVDLTEESLYTLSDGSKSILEKLDAPIKLKLYYSKTAANKGTEGLRTFNNHFRYVNELLRQYVANSRNNLTLDVIDPRPDTPDEEDALAYGLKKFDLTQTESYFFGLVAENESGTEKIIEFFDPGQKDKLEYELTKLIFTVLNPQKKTIGVLSPLEVVNEDMTGPMAQIMRMQGQEVKESWIVTKMLREFYTVNKLELDTDKIVGVDSLVVIHPKGFSEKTLYAIDQYVLGGGNLLVFVDPNALVDRNPMARGPSSSPDAGFKKLMDKWGVELVEGKYAGDRDLSGTGRFAPNQPPGRLLPLLNCNDVCTASHKDNITSGIQTSTFLFPGALKAKEVEGVTHSTLLSTSDKGNTYAADMGMMQNPQMLMDSFSPGKEAVILGYKALGKFKTAFPDGAPKAEGDEEGGKEGENAAGTDSSEEDGEAQVAAEPLKESVKESAVIVFSDVDFIADNMAFKRSFLGPSIANGNSTIFLNGVEALAGDVDLLSVRSKERINRSFTVIDDIEFRAEERTKGKVREINEKITRYQNDLNELGSKANEGNIALLQSEGIKKKKELAKQIAGLKKELRSVKREGREQIETMGKVFQYLNTLLVPLFVIIFGVYFNSKRNYLMRGRRRSGGSLGAKGTPSDKLTEAKA